MDPMKARTLIILISFLTLASPIGAASGEWEALFNGKDLTGWKPLNGQARYEVINGEIVGTSVFGTPNSFLVTDKDYGGFVLELELLVEGEMNSGIQFRSESRQDYLEGRVHGYQCEVDPSERAWSGGIYDEARRGWLYPLEMNPGAKGAFARGGWNRYTIECIGTSIRTWINGVPTAWIYDTMTPSGFIALQVHAIKTREEEGQRIRWRNIRIKTVDLQPAPFEDIPIVNLIPGFLSPAEQQQGFRFLFDGSDTGAWISAGGDRFPEAGWEVRDGNLTVLSTKESEKRGGDIVTREKFKAFELRFEFNLSEGANSGIKYGTGNNGPSIGLEYQILDDARHPDAKMGVVGNRTLASLYDLIPAEKENRFIHPPGEWNRGAIVLYPDNRVEHWLNGRKVVEYVRGSSVYLALVARSKYAEFEGFGMAPETPILLQDHQDRVMFRSIRIRELK